MRAGKWLPLLLGALLSAPSVSFAQNKQAACFCLLNPGRDLFVYACSKLEQRTGWTRPKAECLSTQTGRARSFDVDDTWQRVPEGCGDCKPCVPERLAKLVEVIRGEAQQPQPVAPQTSGSTNYVEPKVQEASFCTPVKP
jgi:hypothetical protein